jgi:hypothetical protein
MEIMRINKQPISSRLRINSNNNKQETTSRKMKIIKKKITMMGTIQIKNNKIKSQKVVKLLVREDTEFFSKNILK